MICARCACSGRMLACIGQRGNMKKRQRDAASDVVAESLNSLASAVNSGEARRAQALESEQRARDALVQQILATPPRQCFTPAALQAFKMKHMAMMQHGAAVGGPQAPNKAPNPPPGTVLAPPRPGSAVLPPSGGGPAI